MARKARGSWLSLKRSIEAEMRAEELKEPLKRFESELKSTVDQVKAGVSPTDLAEPPSPGPAAKTDTGHDGNGGPPGDNRP
jgi:hypothetical protein